MHFYRNKKEISVLHRNLFKRILSFALICIENNLQKLETKLFLGKMYSRIGTLKNALLNVSIYLYPWDWLFKYPLPISKFDVNLSKYFCFMTLQTDSILRNIIICMYCNNYINFFPNDDLGTNCSKGVPLIPPY